jgi:hypothetical protein
LFSADGGLTLGFTGTITLKGIRPGMGKQRERYLLYKSSDLRVGICSVTHLKIAMAPPGQERN